jgi:hypothetical protein
MDPSSSGGGGGGGGGGSTGGQSSSDFVSIYQFFFSLSAFRGSNLGVVNLY